MAPTTTSQPVGLMRLRCESAIGTYPYLYLSVITPFLSVVGGVTSSAGSNETRSCGSLASPCGGANQRAPLVFSCHSCSRAIRCCM